MVAIATDGDGTIIRGGRLARATRAALMRWKLAGGFLFLVTGETPTELSDFPHPELFDRVVAENGALLLGGHQGERPLCEPPPASLLKALRRAGISIKRGRRIIQAECADEGAIRSVLFQLETDWQVVHNRDDLILAPQDINKATGLSAALKEFKIPPRQVAGIGDAENDGPLLKFCGLGIAVNNAVPQLKRQATIVTQGGFGRGIVELVDKLLA